MNKKSSLRPKSAAIGKIKKKSSIKYGLTPEEMYKLDMHQLEYGIDGYEIPKKHFDHRQSKWHKKREEIIKNHKHVWPPEDWPRDNDDKKVKPKRKSYLDDLYKWCYSYYDKEKAERLIDEKGINIKDYEKPLKIDKTRRKDFLENEKKKEEFFKSRPEYPDHKQDAVEAAKERKKAAEEAKIDPIVAMRQKYKTKPQTSRCDRVSVVSEAQFLGENVPFYYTYVPEGEEEDKKKLFFPKKDYTWRRAPAWKYPQDIGPNAEHKKEEEQQHKEKVEEYMNNKKLEKEDLWINIVKSFHSVTHHGENLLRMVPDFKYKDTEQYIAYQERRPKVYIGPQQYWKMPKENFNTRKKPSLSVITDDNGNKIYYMDRKKTDKRVYTAGMRKAVY